MLEVAREAGLLQMGDGRGGWYDAKRKRIAEPANGWIKSVLGSDSSALRGLKKLPSEWSLVCLALKLRQMSPLLEWA